MARGITFLKCLMYFVHFSTVTVFQNRLIPSISSFFVVGLTSRWMNSFSSCHKFSMGLKSGDSGGVFHQLIQLLSRKSATKCEVCFGSLSWTNLCVSKFCKYGTRVLSKISANNYLSITPSKIQIPVAPRTLIPAQTCTLMGCFGLKKGEETRKTKMCT